MNEDVGDLARGLGQGQKFEMIFHVVLSRMGGLRAQFLTMKRLAISMISRRQNMIPVTAITHLATSTK